MDHSESALYAKEKRRLYTLNYYRTISSIISHVNFEYCSIAGSFPLWCMLLVADIESAYNWTPKDIDVFCFESEKFIDTVTRFIVDVSEMKGFEICSNKEVIKARIFDIIIKKDGMYYTVSFINAWRPRATYLEGFDLTSCQVEINSNSLEPKPLNSRVLHDIRSMNMGVLRNMNKKSKTCARTAARILKYLGRGFKVYYANPTIDEKYDSSWATKYIMSDNDFDRMIGSCIRRYSALGVVDQLDNAHEIQVPGDICTDKESKLCYGSIKCCGTEFPFVSSTNLYGTKEPEEINNSHE